MPGRLLSFMRAPSSSSSAKLDNNITNNTSRKNNATTNLPQPSLLPPVYSYSKSPSTALHARSQDSLVMDAFKRHSLSGMLHPDKKTPKLEPQKAAKIDMVVESPPIVFYNNAQNSTGALFSGLLKLDVTEPHITLATFTMKLLATVTAKKPVQQHCQECSSKTTEIHKWEFLAAPTSLRHGMHEFPFSHLLPGHLPATTHGSLAVLDYHLFVVATTEKGDKITFKKGIDVKRAIIPGQEKHSIRIFPPTNLTASVTLPPVIYPIGEFPVAMRLSGIVTPKEDMQSRWRLRKLSWRIEETHKFVSPACPKHAQKVGGEGKGVLHEDVRVVGHEEVKTDWKTDFTEGNIDIEFNAAVNVALKPVCNMESPNGMDVKHNLVIEMVVAEEWAPLKKPNQATPTGAARVLRTQFNLILTERAGLGISWDEEQPPLYEDVPVSPPSYANAHTSVDDYEGTPLSSGRSSFELS